MNYSTEKQNSEDKNIKNDNLAEIQMINLAIKKGKFEDAIKLASAPSLLNISEIQSKLMSIYVMQENFDAALEIGNNPLFADTPEIQSKLISIAILQGRFDDAIKIGSRDIFANNKTIQIQVSNARNFKSKSPQSMLPFEKLKARQQFLCTLKTKLYYDRITPDDIRNIRRSSILTGYQRRVVLLAIYEKQKNIKEISSIVKNYKEQHPDSKQNKVFNTIFERSKNKKSKIFDFMFYDDILDWKIDQKLQNQYKKENEELLAASRVPPKKVSPIIKKTPSTFENTQEFDDSLYYYTSPSYVSSKTSSNNVRNSFVNSLKVTRQTPSKVNTSKKVQTEKTQKHVTHYDEILQYLDTKRNKIYLDLNSTDLSTQKLAISQWDKMELLIEKVKQNRDNSEYLNTLYDKISKLEKYEDSQTR